MSTNTTFTIQKLSKRQSRLRLALIGPSGSGKTYTAQLLARSLTDGRILVIDTERGSAGLYADKFNADDRIDGLDLGDSFAPARYVSALKVAAEHKYAAVIIDSLSHAWMGKDGALEQVDKASKRSQSGNSYVAWREVTPHHNALVDAILQFPGHVICTMRAKTEFVQEKNERTGKTEVRKVGMAPIQRDGMEYEFDVVADMTLENDLIVSKTRCAALSGQIINKPSEALAKTLRDWLESGEPPAAAAVPAAPSPAPVAPGATEQPKEEPNWHAMYFAIHGAQNWPDHSDAEGKKVNYTVWSKVVGRIVASFADLSEEEKKKLAQWASGVKEGKSAEPKVFTEWKTRPQPQATPVEPEPPTNLTELVELVQFVQSERAGFVEACQVQQRSVDAVVQLGWAQGCRTVEDFMAYINDPFNEEAKLQAVAS